MNMIDLPVLLDFYPHSGGAKPTLAGGQVFIPDLGMKKVITLNNRLYVVFFTGEWSEKCERLKRDFLANVKNYQVVYRYVSDYYGPPGEHTAVIRARNTKEAKSVFKSKIGTEGSHGHTDVAAKLLNLSEHVTLL